MRCESQVIGTYYPSRQRSIKPSATERRPPRTSDVLKRSSEQKESHPSGDLGTYLAFSLQVDIMVLLVNDGHVGL